MERSDMDLMIAGNERLIYFAAGKYLPGTDLDEDLVQAGRIGLWKACMRYDPSRGRFSPLAVMCAKNEMLMEMRRRSAGKSRIAVLSLDDPAPGQDGEGGPTIGDMIADPEDRYGAAEYDLSVLRKVLDGKELAVLVLKAMGYTYGEIGDRFGFSRAWAQRLASMAMAKARSAAGIPDSSERGRREP